MMFWRRWWIYIRARPPPPPHVEKRVKGSFSVAVRSFHVNFLPLKQERKLTSHISSFTLRVFQPPRLKTPFQFLHPFPIHIHPSDPPFPPSYSKPSSCLHFHFTTSKHTNTPSPYFSFPTMSLPLFLRKRKVLIFSYHEVERKIILTEYSYEPIREVFRISSTYHIINSVLPSNSL